MITKQHLVDWGVLETDMEVLFADRSVLSPQEFAAAERLTLDCRLRVLCLALHHRSEAAARTLALDLAATLTPYAGRVTDQAEHRNLLVELRRIFALPDSAVRCIELRRWDAAMDAARVAAFGAAAGDNGAAVDLIRLDRTLGLKCAWYAAVSATHGDAVWGAAASFSVAISALKGKGGGEMALGALLVWVLAALGPGPEAEGGSRLEGLSIWVLAALGPGAEGWSRLEGLR